VRRGTTKGRASRRCEGLRRHRNDAKVRDPLADITLPCSTPFTSQNPVPFSNSFHSCSKDLVCRCSQSHHVPSGLRKRYRSSHCSLNKCCHCFIIGIKKEGEYIRKQAQKDLHATSDRCAMRRCVTRDYVKKTRQ